MWKIFVLFCFYCNNVSAASSNNNWGKAADCVGDVLNGTCVEPHRCFATNPYIPGLVHPLSCTQKGGKVGVCCTDCMLVGNSSDALLDRVGHLLWKTGQKSWDKCLEYAQKYKYSACTSDSKVERFIHGKCHLYAISSKSPAGGHDVYRGQFPHMALLGYNGTTTPSQWVCSGSLISERFILTAGHCLYSRELGPVTEAAFGLLRRSDPAEHWHKYKIKRAIPHPQYEPPSKYHDIALLETEIPVVFIDYLILPACLPADEDKINYDELSDISATGWGSLGHMKELADTLQAVFLEKFTDDECSEMYPVHRHQPAGLNTTTQMCYGHRTQVRDTCRGDSGGPLQLDTRKPACMHTLIGVTSYGRECGFEGGAGVYTKIVRYLPWIESVVWPTTTVNPQIWSAGPRNPGTSSKPQVASMDLKNPDTNDKPQVASNQSINSINSFIHHIITMIVLLGMSKFIQN